MNSRSSQKGGKVARRFQEQSRLLRENQLVLAASGLLLRRGCWNLRVEDVADACGVAKGTCYQHFATRPDLLTAAVTRLDKALAKRLLAPPAPATDSRRVCEWASLEAVDAVILTLAERVGQANRGGQALEGKAWPCCLGLVPCPYGGATRSTEVLHRWSKGVWPRPAARATVQTAVLLSLPASYVFGLGHHSPRTNLRTIRSLARQVLRRLL